jgi:DNA-binding IclR family transcriptional regulator
MTDPVKLPRKRSGKAKAAARGLPERRETLLDDETHRSDRQFVTALARGLEILSCFGPRKAEIGGTELAAMTGLPQPTVWRLCHTLSRMGYLIPAEGDKLRPGIPVLKLGRAALACVPLAQKARARMQALADSTGSASGLAARDGGRVVFVQQCLSEAQLVMNLRVGSRLSLVTSAAGWALLAGFPAAERDELIAAHAVPDPRWPQVEAAFREALRDFAARGYILNIGVFHKSYNTAAVPIYGRDGMPVYALTCAGSAATHSPAFLRKTIVPELMKLAAALQAELRALESAAAPPRRG